MSCKKLKDLKKGYIYIYIISTLGITLNGGGFLKEFNSVSFPSAYYFLT